MLRSIAVLTGGCCTRATELPRGRSAFAKTYTTKARLLNRIGKILGDLKRGWVKGRARRPEEPLVVEIYRGYRSSERVFIQGRVMEYENIEVDSADRRWTNFVNALRRLETDEIAGAEVEVQYRGRAFRRTTDSEGYFTIHEPIAETLDDQSWERVTARIVSVPAGEVPDETFHGTVTDLTRTSELAVVTDIDDTILQTGVTSLFKLRALYRTLADNAYTRVPFAGAAELFEGLSKGANPGDQSNPIFYLSNSPWNLYQLLKEFLNVKTFPKGPIFLRDVGLPYEGSPRGGTHKELTLRRLLRDFPTVKFVLVGDSGEADADIYYAAAQEYPERIEAIVIRNVKNNANARRIAKLFARQPGRHFYLVRDSVEAAERLAKLRLLTAEQVETVRVSMTIKRSISPTHPN